MKYKLSYKKKYWLFRKIAKEVCGICYGRILPKYRKAILSQIRGEVK